MAAKFETFSREAIPFEARDGFEWKDHPIFITEDEIDAFLARGGPYSEGRLRTYSFFLTHPDSKERADFIKDEYGTGGSSHALAGADNSHSDYSAKGLTLERGSYGNPLAQVKLSWAKVAQRVDKLIKADRYLTAEDFARIPDYERTQMARKVIWFYDR